MSHQLKLWPQYFKAAWVGDKTFEIRLNDRGFEERDEITLLEYDPKDDAYTGRTIDGVITYMTDYEQKDGYVVFSYRVTVQQD